MARQKVRIVKGGAGGGGGLCLRRLGIEPCSQHRLQAMPAAAAVCAIAGIEASAMGTVNAQLGAQVVLDHLAAQERTR